MRPEVVSSVPPSRPSYGSSTNRANRSPPLSSSSCGRSARPPRDSRRARPHPGSGADDPHAAGSQVVDRLLLRRVQVPRRDELRAATEERQQERHRLRLQVDAGADRQPAERPRLLELLADRRQQPALLDHPLDPLHSAIKDEGPASSALAALDPRRRRAPSGPFDLSTSLDFVEALPAGIRRRVDASPPRWLGGSRQVTGTRLYELVPPLPVLEVSNAGPPPFRGYPQSSGWVRTDATPFARPRRSPAPSSPRRGR